MLVDPTPKMKRRDARPNQAEPADLLDHGRTTLRSGFIRNGYPITMTKHLLRLSFAPVITAVLALAAILAAGAAASAHPHVWVTMEGQLVYAPDGSVTGVRYDWTFDDMFSAFATQGLSPKQPGEFTRQDLAPLAQENVTSLKDFGYFTFGKVNGKKVELKDPTDYYLDYDTKSTVLTLHFTLPFKTPIKSKEINLEIYDPEYFVDFTFKETKDPVALVGAPAGCKLSVQRPHDLVVPPGQALSEAFFNQLSSTDNWGAQFANKISVKCP
jgi:ABC-type uncharacterized transport system substrate-binding protein